MVHGGSSMQGIMMGDAGTRLGGDEIDHDFHDRSAGDLERRMYGAVEPGPATGTSNGKPPKFNMLRTPISNEIVRRFRRLHHHKSA